MRPVGEPSELEAAYATATAEAEAAFGDGGLYLEKIVRRRAPRRGAGASATAHGGALVRGRARVQRAAPPPEAARGVALAVPQRGGAAGALRRRARRRARDALPQCRHDRVPARRRPVLLLHGDEHAAPGRASRERGGDAASTSCARSCASRWGSRCRRRASRPTHGHAIEFRINAEDPSRGFMPSPGPLRRFRPPLGRGVRVDTHAYEGYTVPPTYDSLVAKLIVSDDDRALGARARRAGARGVRGRGRLDDAAAVPRDGRERADVPLGRVHDRLSRRGGGAAILAVRVMTDTPPRAVSRRQARRAAFVLTYQLDVRAGLGSRRAGSPLSRRYRHGRAGLHARGRRGRAARPRRDRRRGRRGRGRLDGRPPGRGRARDPAARDLGAARAASCPAAVVIDEAVELAKRYAGAEAAPVRERRAGIDRARRGGVVVSTQSRTRRPARAARRGARASGRRRRTIPTPPWLR